MPTPVSVSTVRTFNVSAERVFDAWLDQDFIGRWMFGPEVRDEEIVRVRIDARVGGTFSFAVRRDNDVIDHIGEYLEIDRPNRLVFTWGVAGESDGESRVIVDIEPAESGCRLTLTHEMEPQWADYADRARHAWARMLEFLDNALAPSP